MPFNNPGPGHFPATPAFQDHPSLKTKIPTDPKPASQLPTYASEQHQQTLGFYSTDGCAAGTAVIFANGKAFTNVWGPTDAAAKVGKITGPSDVVPLGKFSDREQNLRRAHTLRRVVLLHKRLDSNEILGLTISTNSDEREAILMYAVATQVYRRRCHRCTRQQNIFPHCVVMPDREDGTSFYEEKCVGCHYADAHCVFDPKIKDQPPGELSQQDVFQVVTHAYTKRLLEGLAVSWKSVTNNATFRAGVASVDDFIFRRAIQHLQLNLLGVVNLFDQLNIAPVSILEIRTLSNIPLHNSLAINPEREGDDWPPASLHGHLHRAARSNRIADQPFTVLPPEPESPAPSAASSIGSRSRTGSGMVSRPARPEVECEVVVVPEWPLLVLAAVFHAVVVVVSLAAEVET